MGFWDSLGNDISSGFGAITGTGSGDPSNPYRQGVATNAGQANAYGQQGAANYQQNQQGLNSSIAALQNQAQGGNSVSSMQLQQGLQQNLAAQRSMAASAAPQNAAMAARTAAIQSGQLGAGLAGQQALAGLQERNQAQQALGQLQLGQSGQNQQAALGGYGAANQGYGAALQTPQKTTASALMPAISGIASVFSDRRVKKNIEDGDDDANETIGKLGAYSYDYKDDRMGKGRQFGPMAQELERTSLRSAVIDTPRGKMVDGARAALGSLGLVAALGRRVSELEGKK